MPIPLWFTAPNAFALFTNNIIVCLFPDHWLSNWYVESNYSFGFLNLVFRSSSVWLNSVLSARYG